MRFHYDFRDIFTRPPIEQGKHQMKKTAYFLKRMQEEALQDVATGENSKRQSFGEAYESTKRLNVAEKDLDTLLKPDNKVLSPREHMIYDQTKKELTFLNADNYAINAHRYPELAPYVARRAHLKALIEPGEPRQQPEWEPGGLWAERARDVTKYQYYVGEAEKFHEQIKRECRLDDIKKAIESDALKHM